MPDIVHALKWVRANIVQFGADPDRLLMVLNLRPVRKRASVYVLFRLENAGKQGVVIDPLMELRIALFKALHLA